MDNDRAAAAWETLRAFFEGKNVQRVKHIQQLRGFSSRKYTDIMTYPSSGIAEKEWLIGLYEIFDLVNDLVCNPPRGSGITPSGRVTAGELFGADFPSPPGYRDKVVENAALETGGADIGAGWDRRSTLEYEEILKSQLSKYRTFGDLPRERQVLEKLATLYEASSKWNLAINCLLRLREVNEEFQDWVFIADCYLRSGIAHYRCSDWPSAAQAVEDGLAVVKRYANILSNSKTELRLRSYNALVKLRMNQPKHALQIMNDEVAGLVQRHRSKYVSGTFHHRRAIIYSSLDEFELAHKEFEQAISLRLDCSAHLEVGRTIFRLAQLYHKSGAKPAAALAFGICVDRGLRFQDELGIARSCLSLGDVYADLADAVYVKQSGSVHFDLLSEHVTDAERVLLSRLALPLTSRAEEYLSYTIKRIDLLEEVEGSYRKAIFWSDRAGEPDVKRRADQKLRRWLDRQRGPADTPGV